MIPRFKKKYLMNSPVLAWNIGFRGNYRFTFDLMPFEVRGMGFRKRWNLLSAGMNLVYRNARPWSWPTHMNVELTNVCNLRCPVCPTGAGLLERENSFIDLALFERLMKEVGPRLLMVMLWGWGEPLLHPEFDKAVRIARKHRVIPLISTNGQKLVEESVREKLLADPPEVLIVALDGLTDETNTRYRVGGRLAPILEGVQKLKEERTRRDRQGPHMNMRFIVMKHNEQEVDGVEAFARKHGFDSLSLRSLSIVENKNDVHTDMEPNSPLYKAYEENRSNRMKREKFTCHLAFTFPAVFADGTVVLCDQDANATHPLGRVDGNHSFKTAWFGDRSAIFRKKIRKDRNRISFCRACPYAGRESNTCNVAFRDLRDTT